MSNIHIVCPGCQGINRVDQARLGQAPKCGKCGEQLFQGEPIEVNEAAFQRFLVKSELPVLVDFWAPWCGPCKMMAPMFVEAAGLLEPHFHLLKLNTENNQNISAQLGIRSIPTLAIFKDGKEVTRQAGAMQVQQLVSWARQFA